MQITNLSNVSLALAVWLVSDDYDYVPGDRSISVTSLIKPVRRILLRERLDPTTHIIPDVTDRIAPAMGQTLHAGIEKAWQTNYKQAMRILGYPESIIERVVINPEGPIDPEAIPIYLERRTERQFGDYSISGKLDFCINGDLEDTKSTSVFSYLSGSKEQDYTLQGSLYRWVHRDIVTSDDIKIHFIFTDWRRSEARTRAGYPPHKVHTESYPLMSIQETDQWIKERIRQLEASADLDEPFLPRCNDKDLWRSETVWKYYSDPQKANDPTARATKNFPNAQAAYSHKRSKGVGTVVEVPGKVRACSYCDVFNLCTQKDEYEHG